MEVSEGGMIRSNSKASDCRRIVHVAVFGTAQSLGNPLAVVVDSDAVSDKDCQRLARWLNFSETAFLCRAQRPEADYRARIYTPDRELPFAGHPTLGACHVWLMTRPRPAILPSVVLQEVSTGIVEISTHRDTLALRAPPVTISELARADIAAIAAGLGVDIGDVVAGAQLDNGPVWNTVLLRRAHSVRALAPRALDRPVAVVACAAKTSRYAVEMRAFGRVAGQTVEDVGTGALAASTASWLASSGIIEPPYCIRQAAPDGREAALEVNGNLQRGFWVGGVTRTIMDGRVYLECCA
jgi:PhzF family phenazine biosynthesis protein